MIYKVTLLVDVDLTAWADEYGCTVPEATEMVLQDLREPGWYLTQEKWSLVKLHGLAVAEPARIV